MNRARELVLHRVLTAGALLAAVAANVLPRSAGPSAQERVAVSCACGSACKCADGHAAAVPKDEVPAQPREVVENLLAARLAANESAAIATLRNLTSAQGQIQSSGLIDCDGDGIGEYAYLGELAGTHPLREQAGKGSRIGSQKLDPAVLPKTYGKVAGGAIERSGYLLRVFLVDAKSQGLAELASGGADPARMPDPDLCEIVWCAYAWPMEHGATGNRAFFVNQEGDLVECANARKRYTGAALAPAAHAAFAQSGKAGVIDQPLASGTPSQMGMDGEVWSLVQ